MPDKDLQRLTNSVVYIDHGQGSRHLLPARRNHINLESEDRRATHALHQRHNHEHPADVFLRPNNPDCYLELIDLYDMATRPLSLALQHGPKAWEDGRSPRWSQLCSIWTHRLARSPHAIRECARSDRSSQLTSSTARRLARQE